MKIELDAVEARILGALIEKFYLTPELYPLSFNALLNACNQKTSRDPVLSLDTEALGKGLASLCAKGLAAQRYGSRVPKYAHRAEELGAGASPEAIGTLCVLLLRGPQTAAEVRARTEKITQFPAPADAEKLLESLAQHPSGPFVERLARGRYRQLFSPAPAEAPIPAPYAPAPAAAAAEERMAALEERCRALEERLARLERREAAVPAAGGPQTGN